jgi:signal transduction histidine kinase
MTFKTKTTAGLVAALAILIIVCFYSYRNLVRSEEERAWVIHTHLVLETIDALQGDLTDAETGQRGYLLTGEESYLRPYNNALNESHLNLKSLRSLTDDNPVQQEELDLLEPMVTKNLNELQYRIDIRTKLGLKALIESSGGGAGIGRMDEVRAQLEKMRIEERRHLTLRSAGAEASSHRTKATVVGGDIVAVLFACLGGFVIRQEMQRRREAEEALRSLNSDLERRIAERTAELAERAKDLARSNSELQQFAYVASHDLQEPLRMVASFTQLLGRRYKDKLDNDARDFINYAVDGATRMQSLISDLLTYSRVGTQAKPLAATSCDDVLDRVLLGLSIAIEENHAVIEREPLPTVMADSLQIGQLFQNLIANAIKFHGSEVPRVHIRADRDGSGWKFSVRDNGIGIAPEHAERIFAIFQRLHTRTEYPGTGIGLAVCKKIVERHGGRIWIEPAPVKGTIFCFLLPAVAGPLHREEEAQHELRIPIPAD